MEKHLVLIGGGHAHMVTLANLHQFINRGHKVTVIGPSVHHYYSGMGPGMLSRIYTPGEIRFRTRHLVEKQGGTFVLDKVKRIDPDSETVFLESGDTIGYNVLSINAGSYVSWENVSDNSGDIYSVKPIERLLEAQKRLVELSLQPKTSVGIVGGGASSVEIAGNVWRLLTDENGRPDIKIFTGNRLLNTFPEKVRKKAIASLVKRDIAIIEETYVSEVTSGAIKTESGDTHNVDLIFLALGVKPSPIFIDSGLSTGPDGGLLVNEFLQSPEYPNIFGGGDCIYFQKQPLDKVGVYAVRQNPILFQNLMATLEGNALSSFDPGKAYLLIFNMGDGSGIFYKQGVLIGGRLAFLIKDYIDRKFMSKFQAFE